VTFHNYAQLHFVRAFLYHCATTLWIPETATSCIFGFIWS